MEPGSNHSTSLGTLTSCSGNLYCALVQEALLQNYPNSKKRQYGHMQLKQKKQECIHWAKTQTT